ncbi:META domain-containing protein [Pseudochryseolinea flava]|uniref:META domain-containing protein n=1 Tax=Pseudochryseolinea flava TaxID=2059302 RepID=A0A364XYX6_9BACT|nr:META domain-containing protein [Pseudochryseolinea flava]RAV99562.1 META domain-containing protein [Pseudochryseolinea flava]
MKYIASIFMMILICQCKPAEKTSASTASLENTYWKLSEMNGIPVSTPENQREVHFVLTKDGSELRVKGFAGCNTMGGSYTVNNNTIKFSTFSTKMMCSERMDIETFMFSTLNDADNFKIKGETLELYQGNTFLAKFESVYFK